MGDFSTAVQLVLNHEGGYTAGLPDDPGGETNWGISKRAYPNLDIKNLSKEAAIEIYKRDYWQFDDLEDQHLANCALDCAVNQGLYFCVSRIDMLRNQHQLTLQNFQVERLVRYSKTIVNNLKLAQYIGSWARRTLDV